MAGAVTVKMNLEITGLGDAVEVANKFTATVPVEFIKQYAVIGATAAQLDIGNVALDKVYGLWIKAVVDKIYLKLDATTGDLSASDAPILLNEGESDYISINPADNTGIRIDGDAATSACSYVVLGKA